MSGTASAGVTAKTSGSGGIGGIFKKVGSAISSTAQKAGGALTSAAKSTANAVSGAVDKGKQVVSGAVNAGKNVVSGAVNAGKSVVSGAVNAGKSLVSGAVNAGKSLVSGAVNKGKQLVSGAVNTGKSIVSGAVNTGKKLVSGAVNTGKKLVSGAVDAGKKLVSGAVDKGKQLVSGAVNAGKKLVSGAVNTGKKLVSGAVDAGKKVLGKVGDVAATGLAKGIDVASKAIAKTGELASKVTGKVTDTAKSALNKVTSLGQGALDKLKGHNSVLDKVADAGKSALNKINTTGSNALDKVKSTANTIKDVLGGKTDDKPFDGKLVDVNGKTYDPSTPLSQVAGNNKGPTVLEVNGITNDVANQQSALQAIEKQTGAHVVGIHNATEGFLKDGAQVFMDKLHKGSNPAVDTTSNTIYNELKAGRDVHILAHSQGGAITSRALYDVKQRLMVEDGLSKQQAEDKLSHVGVESFGSAASTWPDGPQYVHYVNKLDVVPDALGLGLQHFQGGRGAVIHYGALSGHGLEDSYLPTRAPFEEARRGDFSHAGQTGF